jgi:hypothetical protein
VVPESYTFRERHADMLLLCTAERVLMISVEGKARGICRGLGLGAQLPIGSWCLRKRMDRVIRSALGRKVGTLPEHAVNLLSISGMRQSCHLSSLPLLRRQYQNRHPLDTVAQLVRA